SQSFQVSGAADLPHLPLDLAGAPLHVGTRVGGTVATRAGEDCGQPGRSRCRELARVLAAIAPRGRLGSIHAVTELGDVVVHLRDPLLWPQRLDQRRVPGVQAFADPAAPSPQERVLCRLLADGARPAQATATGVALGGVADRVQVEPVVIGEPL